MAIACEGSRVTLKLKGNIYTVLNIREINYSSFGRRDGTPSFMAPLPDIGLEDHWPRVSSDVLEQGFHLTWDPTARPCDFCE